MIERRTDRRHGILYKRMLRLVDSAEGIEKRHRVQGSLPGARPGVR